MGGRLVAAVDLVSGPQVATKLVQSMEVLTAVFADMISLNVVGSSMFRQIGRFAERFGADLALQWLFACMCSFVHRESALLLEGLATTRMLALPGHIPRVSSHMLIQGLLRRELEIANFASDRFESCVCLRMPLQLALLSESSLSSAAMPFADKTTTLLLDQILGVFLLAVVLKVLRLLEHLTTETTIAHPPAPKLVVFSHRAFNRGRHSLRGHDWRTPS